MESVLITSRRGHTPAMGLGNASSAANRLPETAAGKAAERAGGKALMDGAGAELRNHTSSRDSERECRELWLQWRPDSRRKLPPAALAIASLGAPAPSAWKPATPPRGFCCSHARILCECSTICCWSVKPSTAGREERLSTPRGPVRARRCAADVPWPAQDHAGPRRGILVDASPAPDRPAPPP